MTKREGYAVVCPEWYAGFRIDGIYIDKFAAQERADELNDVWDGVVHFYVMPVNVWESHEPVAMAC